MTHSIRLFIRDGQQCDLSIQEVPECDCDLKINPDPIRDDGIVIDLSIHSRTKAQNPQVEINDAVHRSTAQEEVGERDGDVVRVGNQVGFNALNHANLHAFNSQQSVYSALNTRSAGATKESSEAAE